MIAHRRVSLPGSLQVNDVFLHICPTYRPDPSGAKPRVQRRAVPRDQRLIRQARALLQLRLRREPRDPACVKLSRPSAASPYVRSRMECSGFVAQAVLAARVWSLPVVRLRLVSGST